MHYAHAKLRLIYDSPMACLGLPPSRYIFCSELSHKPTFALKIQTLLHVEYSCLENKIEPEMTADEELVLKAFRAMSDEGRVNAKNYMIAMAKRCPNKTLSVRPELKLVTNGAGVGVLLARIGGRKN